MQAELVACRLVDDDLPCTRWFAVGDSFGSASTGGRVVAEHVGEPATDSRCFDERARVRRPSAHATPSTARTASTVSGGAPTGTCAWCGRPSGDEDVGGGVAQVGGDLAHGTSNDAVEDEYEQQRHADAEHGERGPAAVLERFLRASDTRPVMTRPGRRRRFELGEPPGGNDGSDHTHEDRGSDSSRHAAAVSNTGNWGRAHPMSARPATKRMPPTTSPAAAMIIV